ncbi:MAG: Ribosome hibernation promoting factor [Planctomycetota bacterium]|jgi:putative sigma-54 modulation protein
MQVTITGKHLDITPAIDTFIRGKCDRLQRHFDGLQQVDFVLEKDPRHGFHAELILDIEHHDDFISNAHHDDLYAAVDLVLDRGVRQLTDHKDRLRNHKHAGGEAGS